MYGTGFSVATVAWEVRVEVISFTLHGAAGQPVGAAAVEVLHLGAGETGHVALDVVADPGLDVGEVAIARREPLEQRRIELGSGPARHRGQTVDLIDRLAEAEAPGFRAALEEVIEAPGADD